MIHCPWSGIMGLVCGFLSMKLILWKPVSFPCNFYSSFPSSGWHYNHIHTWRRFIYFLCLILWGKIHIYLSNFAPSFVLLVSKVVKDTTFVLLLSSNSVSKSFSTVDFSPCLLIWRCPIFVFVYFSICFLVRWYVRPGQVFIKTCLITLRSLADVGMKSVALRYCASSVLVFWSIMLFATIYDCCVSGGTSHIPFFLFLVPFIIFIYFFGITFLDCLVWWWIHDHIRLPTILEGLF